MHFGRTVIFLRVRENIYVHLPLFLFRKRDVILDLDSLDANFIQHITQYIHRIRVGFQRKTYPFHNLCLPFYITLSR